MLVRPGAAGYDSSPVGRRPAWPEVASMWNRPYTWLPLLLLVVLGLLLGGCRTLNFGGAVAEPDKGGEKPIPVADPKVPVPAPEPPGPFARPGKYSLRIAPYVFHSDFELKRDRP